MNINRPSVCTQQEEACLEFVWKHIQINEPVCVIGIRGMGKDILFRSLLKKLSDDKTIGNVISADISNSQDLQKLIQGVTVLSKPKIVIISFSENLDFSETIFYLGEQRKKETTNFTYVVFSSISPIFSALESGNKAVSRSLFFLKPLNTAGCARYFSNLGKRYGFKLTNQDKKTLQTLSGGHVGLIKSLFIYKQIHPEDDLRIENLLQDESILYRLNSILEDVRPIYSGRNGLIGINETNLSLLKKFGLIHQDRLFCPLLTYFLQINKLGDTTALDNLTAAEIRVFNLLKDKFGVTIDRENVAKVIWGDDWEEKYSDWAIDQTIHRLRQKIKQIGFPYELKTKKGLGFVLTSR